MSAPIAHGGAISAAVARYGGLNSDWLDLSTGLNPCPPALPALDPRVWHRLPDEDLLRRAEEAAANFYGAIDVWPLAVAGTQAAIQLLPRLVQPGRYVAIVSPTYGEYARVFAQSGFTVEPIPDLDAIAERHAAVIVVNPNNPDGRVHSPQHLAQAAGRLAGWGGLLVVDEAFADCSPEISLAGAVRDHDNLVVFKSFGKFIGLAGVRLGFVLTAQARRAGMETMLGPWSVSGPALALAETLMREDPGEIRRRIDVRKQAQSAVISEARLQVVGGTALFSLIECEQARQLHDHLCRNRILTRSFDYASSWLRIGLAPDDAGDLRLGAALASWRQSR